MHWFWLTAAVMKVVIKANRPQICHSILYSCSEKETSLLQRDTLLLSVFCMIMCLTIFGEL